MATMIEGLWARALRAAEARGLLPVKRSSLTPRELAAAAAWRGENRLTQLVEGWYYPRSYGHARGALTDEQAGGIVAALEAHVEITSTEIARTTTAPAAERSSKPRIVNCDLCGRPLGP
jgi:hypothetical protein